MFDDWKSAAGRFWASARPYWPYAAAFFGGLALGWLFL